MTEHSLKELERQYAQAQTKAHDANVALRKAADRLASARGEAMLAELAKRGIVAGKTKVMISPNVYGAARGERPNGPFFVSGYKAVYVTRATLVFAKVKADGTPSKRGSGVYWSHNYDLNRIVPMEGP